MNKEVYIKNVLDRCSEKLSKYRETYGGQYVGGVEYTDLQKMIENAKELLND